MFEIILFVQNFRTSPYNGSDFSLETIINLFLAAIVVVAFIFEILKRKRRKKQAEEDNDDFF